MTAETERPAPDQTGARDGALARMRAFRLRWPETWRGRLFLAARVFAWLLAVGAGLPLLWASLYGVAPVPGTILMAQRALEGERVRYEWRPIEAISPNLVRAVIAAEDSRFCAHQGFDIDAIQQILSEGGERMRGGSTISQQAAKNAYLWPQRSWIRKGGETWFTMLDEALWTKRRTMEVYLNIAEWGDGLFGAEAAARARFGKSAADLTEQEAALMAAVLPNPNEWRLDPPGPYVSGRAGTLRQRMNVVRSDRLDACIYGG